MAKQIEVMQLREEAIFEILQRLSSVSKGFSEPKLILIGGYALRAYVDLSRHTRDCDFVVRDKCLEQVKEWLGDLSVEAFEQSESHGYLRLLKLLKAGRGSSKVSVDFMQGQVVGRVEEDKVIIDRKFVQNSKSVSIKVGSRSLDFFLPDYTDYLVLKIASARPSDIRDIAALVWKNGIPTNLKDRALEIVFSQEVFRKNIKEIMQALSERRFVDSWRGTFLIKDFTEDDKEKVICEILSLFKTMS